MNNSNKIRILWFVIILLGVLNIATIGTIIYHNNSEKERTPNIAFEPNANPLSGKYCKQVLGFNNEQMECFRACNHVFYEKASAIIDSMNTEKEKLFSELQKPNVDTAELKKISGEIGRLHGRLKEKTVDLYLSLNNVCDSSQKNELKAMFKPLFQETPVRNANREQGHRRKHGNSN